MNPKPIGSCGRACVACQWFKKEKCSGCEAENMGMEDNVKCIIFLCTREKRVAHCLQCKEMPCNLLKSITFFHCPVYHRVVKNRLGDVK
ncbi:MAG: DUF3795 domain-containing protein [Candidatus Aenigmatarchaeota archaeon]